MEKNEKRTMFINRVLSFAAGGLLVFAVMSFTVVNSAKAENKELSQALDTSRFEAGRLLEDARAQLSAGDYEEAEASLTVLFANQPGSPEATEGKALLATVKQEAAAADQRWEAALPSIRKEWTETMAAELRAELEANRAKFENDLEATINKAWEKARSDVRVEWSGEQQS
ncbi:MAG: hypothetical protein GVY23_02145 [Spirochaetes bacterium]|jgi:predicted Zn-dependent protease|nr:hypothetical protein [Spirochaetota bacterium]